MISRYSRDQMRGIWSEENKWRLVLEVELLACEACEKIGMVPEGVSGVVRDRARVDVHRIAEIEADVGHDLIAFLTSIAESVGEEARHLHFGMTSSDVLDTCLSVQLRDSCDLLLSGLASLLEAIRGRAMESRDMLCVGRTHGMYAEPTTIGLKFARMYAEFSRAVRRLEQAKEEISVCAISGAVGTYSALPPFVEQYVADAIGLEPDVISSQVIARDRHAALFACFGVIAGSIENAATEIRHMQRSEVAEFEEPFGSKQKGSSAMPHKRNPILSENLTGIARLVRSYVAPALENVALWHERDISHSSVERVIAPDACILLDFAIARLRHVVANLNINEHSVAKNLKQASALMKSQRLLLLLVDRGMCRDSAYRLVQRNTFSDAGFFDSVLRDQDVLAVVGADELSQLFENDAEVGSVDFLFDRVFGDAS